METRCECEISPTSGQTSAPRHWETGGAAQELTPFAPPLFLSVARSPGIPGTSLAFIRTLGAALLGLFLGLTQRQQILFGAGI